MTTRGAFTSPAPRTSVDGHLEKIDVAARFLPFMVSSSALISA